MLDIRGAVWNNSDAPRAFQVEVFPDEEHPDDRLHHETLTVPPHSASGVTVRWPTKAEAGKHTFLLVAESSEGTRRISKQIKVLESEVRSTRRVDGAWCSFNLPEMAEGKIYDPVLRQMTDDQWAEMVRGMHDVGMNIIVLQESEHWHRHNLDGGHHFAADDFSARAFYPSSLFTNRMPMTANDPIEAVLSEVDKLGMHVFTGVGLFAWFDFTPESLTWHKRLANELCKPYGDHPSFYGWYVSEEKNGGPGNAKERNQIVEFFSDFTAHVRSLAPDKPVMLAPNCYNMSTAADTYRKLLLHLDILCPFAFQRLPEGQSGERRRRSCSPCVTKAALTCGWTWRCFCSTSKAR